MSRKIKVTKSDYPFAIPNGTVMRVVGRVPGGVFAESDDTPGRWAMLIGTYEYLDDGIKLEVGKFYELNNGDAYECERMIGDDPLAVDNFDCGPFIIDGCLYHQDGRFANCDADDFLSVKCCVPDETKKWKYMSPEEKGALLLAHHEGRGIEVYFDDRWLDVVPTWESHCGYRIKPEPVRDKVTLYYGYWGFASGFGPEGATHTIAFDTVDGVPVCDSIRMDPVS